MRLVTTASNPCMVLLIPGSRLKATNSPSARPYCNRQPLEKFRGSNETAKIYQRETFSRELFLPRKFPDLLVYLFNLTLFLTFCYMCLYA